MSINRTISAISIVAVVLGGTGLGFGVFSMITLQDELNSSNDGDDLPEKRNPIVGILDPDESQAVSGIVLVRAMIWCDLNYAVQVLLNDSLKATHLPYSWNTTTFSDGWWNLSVVVIDSSGSVGMDCVLVKVDNAPVPGVKRTWYLYDDDCDTFLGIGDEPNNKANWQNVFEDYDLYLEIQVNEGENIHLSFQATIMGSHMVLFCFVDGLDNFYDPQVEVSFYPTPGSRRNLHITTVIQGLAPGSHRFTLKGFCYLDESYVVGLDFRMGRILMAQTVVP
ncbi:MAG: hypothetical protein ACFFAS_10735 [Promethearchaeota archaeon]